MKFQLDNAIACTKEVVMPIPAPSGDQDRQSFISSCMGNETMRTEYDQKQRAAICYSRWREHAKSIGLETDDQTLLGFLTTLISKSAFAGRN